MSAVPPKAVNGPDPTSREISQDLHASARPSPGLGESIFRGAIGFTLLSIAGFAPWALAGRFFYRSIGEIGLYVVCALVFIGLSAPLLHKLLSGPGSFGRFYKLFSISFAGYSIAWIAGWMMFGGHLGSVVGLLAGSVVMGLVLAALFRAWRRLLPVVIVLFLANALGYFVGGVVEAEVSSWQAFDLFGTTVTRRTISTVGKLLWGVCYGLGFGAGLGATFHLLQKSTLR